MLPVKWDSTPGIENLYCNCSYGFGVAYPSVVLKTSGRYRREGENLAQSSGAVKMMLDLEGGFQMHGSAH